MIWLFLKVRIKHLKMCRRQIITKWDSTVSKCVLDCLATFNSTHMFSLPGCLCLQISHFCLSPTSLVTFLYCPSSFGRIADVLLSKTLRKEGILCFTTWRINVSMHVTGITFITQKWFVGGVSNLDYNCTTTGFDR